MSLAHFIHCARWFGAAFVLAPWFCALFMLSGCGGESDSSPSSASSIGSQPVASETHYTYRSSAVVPRPPAPNPRPMAGFVNLGSTCYANAALKFLIHSTEPLQLRKHLLAQVATGDAPQREAAQKFVQLIESIHSETAPAPLDLSEFLASLQKLPAFSSLDAQGALAFQIIGQMQDANEFLMKLSQAFALHQLHADPIALGDDSNAFKTDGEYWTILQPGSAQDSLQEVLDRTAPARWKVTPGQELRQLTVQMKNAVDDRQGQHMLGTRNFDFGQTARLKTTHGAQTTVLTLEPRAVIEFVGTEHTGHYIVYAKDQQWVRYDDDQVTVLDQAPRVENARFIHFAIRKIETESSSAS